MSYKIIITSYFKKEAKDLLKKYASLKNELKELGELLILNPNTGIHLSNNIYKIRLSIKSKNKGKSGGARVIYFVKVEEENIYLVTIYNKGDIDNITIDDIQKIIDDSI